MPSVKDHAPTISVIMAAFNAERTIDDALCSVLSQTYSDFEIVVCDDASTDETARIVEEVDDSRVRLIRNQVNSGPGPSRDHAIRCARGRWIIFLDADDQFAPARLETLLQVAESYPDDIIADAIVDCHDTPRGLIPWRLVWKGRYPETAAAPFYRIDFVGFIGNERTLIKPLIRKDLAIFLGASHGNKTSGEDVAFLFHFFAHGSVIRYVPKPLYYYRMTSGSLSSSKPDRHVRYREVFELALSSFLWSPTDSSAIQAKIDYIRRQETYQAFYNAIRGFRFPKAWGMAITDSWLLTELALRIIDRIPFHLHRIMHSGVRRRVG